MTVVVHVTPETMLVEYGNTTGGGKYRSAYQVGRVDFPKFSDVEVSIRKSIAWPGYVEALQARFGTKLYGDPVLEMRNLQQEGSFSDYQRWFNILFRRIQLLDAVLERKTIRHFVGGLDHELHAPVRFKRVQTLLDENVVVKLYYVVLSSQHPYNMGKISPFVKTNSNMKSTAL